MQFVEENLSTWDDAYLAVTEMENPSIHLNDSPTAEEDSTDDEENDLTTAVMNDLELNPLALFRNCLKNQEKDIFHFEDRPLLTFGGSPRQKSIKTVPGLHKTVQDEHLLRKPSSSPLGCSILGSSSGPKVRAFPSAVKSNAAVVAGSNKTLKKPSVPVRPSLPKPSAARSASAPQSSNVRSSKSEKVREGIDSKIPADKSGEFNSEGTKQNSHEIKEGVNKRENRRTASIGKPMKPLPQAVDLLDIISSSVLLLYEQFSSDFAAVCPILQEYATAILTSHKSSNSYQTIDDALKKMSSSKSKRLVCSARQQSLCNVIRMLESVPNHRSTDEIVLILTWISNYLPNEPLSSIHSAGEKKVKGNTTENLKEQNIFSFHHFKKLWRSMVSEIKSTVSAIDVVHNDRSVNKELIHKDQYHHQLQQLRQLYTVNQMQGKKKDNPLQYFVDRMLWEAFGKSENTVDGALTIPALTSAAGLPACESSVSDRVSVTDQKVERSAVSLSAAASVSSSSSRVFPKSPDSGFSDSRTSSKQPSYMALPSRPPTAGPIRLLGKESRKESFSLESKGNSLSRCVSTQQRNHENSSADDALWKKILVRQHCGLLFFQRVSSSSSSSWVSKDTLKFTKKDVLYEKEHHFIKDSMIYSPLNVHPKDYLLHYQSQAKQKSRNGEKSEMTQEADNRTPNSTTNSHPSYEQNLSDPSYIFLTKAPKLSSEQAGLFLFGILSDIIRSFLVRSLIFY
jgi:hypothetical protein